MGVNVYKNVESLQRQNWNDKNVRDNFKDMLINTTSFHECDGYTVDIDYKSNVSFI